LTTSSIRDIFRINLGVKKNETVLLLTDLISQKKAAPSSPLTHKGKKAEFSNTRTEEAEEQRGESLRCLALLAAEIGKSYCKKLIYHEYPATGSHGAEPPVTVWELAFGKKTVDALKKSKLLLPVLQKTAKDYDISNAEEIIRKNQNSAVDCVIALAHYSTSHTRFRDFLTRICGCRYASMPLFEISMLEGSMQVDWKALAKRTITLAKTIEPAEFIDITTRNGTKISFSKKERKALADTGILTKKGSFGNLPAGEVFLAPVEGTANGRLILEWGPTRQLASPVTLTVRGGLVVDVSGKDEYALHLQNKLSERPENRNIAELGIGTNDAAKRPDNILESEKILGTIHIALGDNSSFGGKVKTPFHQDFVFFRPTVTLLYKDKSRQDILKTGRLLCKS
jgi:aminopeptidase